MNDDLKVGRVKAPRAPKKPVTSLHHGLARADDYAWLRASNWQAVMRDPSVLDADIRAHLEAENAHTEAEMADSEALQRTLFAEMKGRIKEDDSSVPAPDGAFAYYARFVPGGEHPLFCRAPRAGGAERVLIDANELAREHAYFRIANVVHSPDHRFIAYAADTNGSEFYRIHIVDAETGALIGEPIENGNGSLEWAADSQTLLYVWLDEEHRPRRIFAHRLGSESADTLIHEQPDPAFFLGLGATQSRRFLTVSVHDHETAEVRLVDASAPLSSPRLVAARKPEHDYSVEHQGEDLIILTNSDGAEDYRIVAAPVESPGPELVAGDRAASAGTPDPRRCRLQASSRPPRARGRIAAYCHPPSCRRRRARDRLPRGGLRARPLGRLRIRHDDAPLHLFLHDDAGTNLRLRHGEPRACPPEDAGGSERPRSEPLRHPPHHGAGKGRRNRSGLPPLP